MIPPILKPIRPDLREYFGLASDTLWRGKDVLIIVGQNGAGKSMVRRMLRQGAKDRKIDVCDFSQERRCGGGMANAFIYGAEDYESTGYITLRGFRTSFNQPPELDRLYIWDEPEIGLSEESQLGVVKLIRDTMEAAPKHLVGCVFMTHSRLFAKGFVDYPRTAFIDLDGKYQTLTEWADRAVVAADIESVLDHGLTRFRELTNLLRTKQGDDHDG